MAYNHTAVLLLGAILVVICTGKDINCTYNLKCEINIRDSQCRDYSHIRFFPMYDCTTVIYPTSTEYQSATPPTMTSSACYPSSANSRPMTSITSTTTTTTKLTTLPSSTAVAATCNCLYSTTGPVADTLPATLHGVYMTVLLVLVAVTITMTTLVVYMCLMMRRAKSGRVPQTTTGTTHTNNMAASDYCEPTALQEYLQSTKTGKETLEHSHIHTAPTGDCHGNKSQPTSRRATSTQAANFSNTGRVHQPSQPPLPHLPLPLPLPPDGDTVYSQISDTCKPTLSSSEPDTMNENPAYGCSLTNKNPAYGCGLINENPAYGCGLTDDNYSLLHVQAPTSLFPTSNAVHSTQLSDVYDCTPLDDPEYELLDDVRKQSNKDIVGDEENKQGEKQEHDTCTKQVKETNAVSTQPETD